MRDVSLLRLHVCLCHPGTSWRFPWSAGGHQCWLLEAIMVLSLDPARGKASVLAHCLVDWAPSSDGRR